MKGINLNGCSIYRLKIDADEKAGVWVASKILDEDVEDRRGTYLVSEESFDGRPYVVYILLLDFAYSDRIRNDLEAKLDHLDVPYILVACSEI